MAENLQLPRVYIANLGQNITCEDVKTAFSQCGNVKDVRLAMNPTGVNFLDFETVDEAKTACKTFNGKEVLGSNRLRLEIAERKYKSEQIKRFSSNEAKTHAYLKVKKQIKK